MGMELIYRRLTEADLSALEADPERAMSYLFSLPGFDLAAMSEFLADPAALQANASEIMAALENAQADPTRVDLNTLGVFPLIMEFKTIIYRGGLVTFRIPSHWREEYEPDGGGTFYDDDPDSGTLGLNVITAKAPMPITTRSGPDILAGLVQTSATAELLANNCALVRYEQRAEEQGHPLHITLWSVAQPLPPNHARIATFSYTMRAHQRNDPQFQAELDMLDREIRAVGFAPMLSGDLK